MNEFFHDLKKSRREIDVFNMCFSIYIIYYLLIIVEKQVSSTINR